ncbi:MAG: LSM domain-containing protein [Halobacteriaceae archaeon]
MDDGRPLDVLEAALESPVEVRLKDGAVYHGALAGYDQHMNLVLSPPTEAADVEEAVEDTTVIRGDNVVTIKP